MKNPKKVKKQKKKTKVLDSSHIQDPKLPFNAHVAELRARLMWSALSILCGGVVGYFLYDKILNFLIKPLNQPLYYSSPAGGFDFTFKICIFFGILVSIPILTYHTLKFITPILPVKYHHRLLTFLSVSCVLMALGVCFAYYVSLPAALHFLGIFGSKSIHSLISTDSYLSFVSRYILGFGILFQLPLIFVSINMISPLSLKFLLNQEKWVLLGSFIFAAILTPTPDAFNQALMAVPIILLYQITILAIWMINGKKLGISMK